jgi:uncharacterized phage-like protein YoqJ
MITSHAIVSFTGHRTYDRSCDKELRDIIHKLYTDGARTFRIGMAEGFDLAAGNILLELIDQHDDIILEAHIPWPQFASRLNDEDRNIYNLILAKVKIIRYAGYSFHPDIFHRRNDMLTDNATHLIAWWNGSKSGTGYTVKRAQKLGCTVINLHYSAQREIPGLEP